MILSKIVCMVTSGTAYQDVTMTDTLSNYVEFSHPDAQNFGAELVIRDKDGHTVDPSVVGLAGYTITAQPGSKTISISFPQGYALKDGYTYSLEYTIVPSAKAYEDYAANANAGTTGMARTPPRARPTPVIRLQASRASGATRRPRSTTRPAWMANHRTQSKTLNTRTRSSRSILRSLPS